MECGDTALHATGFFRIEILVGLGKKFFDSLSIPTVDRNADARGDPGLVLVLGHDHANAIRYVLGFFVLRFRQNEREFIAPIARGGIDGAAMNAQNGGEAAERAAANEMAEAIINFLQTVQIQEQNGERPARSVGTLGFILEDVEEFAVIGEARERVAYGDMADLFKEPRVIEKRAAEGEGVAAHGKDLGEHEGSVEKALRLASSKLSGEVHPGGRIDGAIERGVFGVESAPIPNHGRQKD